MMEWETRSALDAHLARIDLHILDVLLIDLLVIVRHMTQPRLLNFECARGHADVDTLDHDITLRLGVAQTLPGRTSSRSKSTTSPLRPRVNGACPTPKIFRRPSARFGRQRRKF